MTTHVIEISPNTAETREEITRRREVRGEFARPITYAIVKAVGPRDRVAERDGAAPVETIEIRTESLSHRSDDLPHTDLYTVFIRLGEDLTRPQIEAALTTIAAEGILEDAFEDIAKAGQHRAEVRDHAVQQIQDRAAALIAETLNGAGDTPSPASGWVRHRVHERAGMGLWLTHQLWPASDMAGLALWLESNARIALAWDPADNSRAVTSRAEDYVRALAASGERPPLDRPVVVAAAWSGGCRNVKALAEGLGATRQTIYGDLEAAGLGR